MLLKEEYDFDNPIIANKVLSSLNIDFGDLSLSKPEVYEEFLKYKEQVIEKQKEKAAIKMAYSRASKDIHVFKLSNKGFSNFEAARIILPKIIETYMPNNIICGSRVAVFFALNPMCKSIYQENTLGVHKYLEYCGINIYRAPPEIIDTNEFLLKKDNSFYIGKIENLKVI